MADLSGLGKSKLPHPPPLSKLIGPSFILLGMGLGSGELILWPYLSSNFGLGIIWAAVVGITLQFFIDMEIERYTLATGESIFVGFTRKFGRFAPIWFILSTLIPWIWPGIIASSAAVFAKTFGISYTKYPGIALLLLIGGLLSLGKIIYKTQEKIQKIIILFGVPFVFGLTIFLADPSDWIALINGLWGRGEGFHFIPPAVPIATFLGALAYAGAGGNLNLVQSLYAKEKGYGMAKYSGKLTNIFKDAAQKVSLEGSTFECTQENVKTFNIWWRRINIEHALVFWATGTFTMILLSLLAYSTVYGNPNLQKGINFILEEAVVIGSLTIRPLESLFLIMVGVMLFGTQFSVFGSTARIMSENLVLALQDKFCIKNLPKYFFFFLWLQIISGILVFLLGFTEPLALIVTGAVLNAFSMFIYSGMVLATNLTLLEKPLRPSIFRILAVGVAFTFYGGFSIYTLAVNLQNLLA